MERLPAKTFQDLVVWQKAHALVLEIYRLSERFPKHETFGLRLQLRKAAVSVPANIAEGFKKWGWRDQARFLNIGQGSLEEVRYYLILSRDLGYSTVEPAMLRLEEVSKLLVACCSSLRARWLGLSSILFLLSAGYWLLSTVSTGY